MARRTKARNQENMFPQKRIPAIERWIIKADEKRTMVATLKDELKNAEFKLKEAIHANEADVAREATDDGGTVLKYERGTYKAEAKRGKETVNYTRGGEAKSETDVPEESDRDEAEDEGGE